MEVKYKIDRLRLKVRISRRISNKQLYYHETLTEEDVADIDGYIKEHNLGKRMAYDMWKFKDDQSLTMFMLKYG